MKKGLSIALLLTLVLSVYSAYAAEPTVSWNVVQLETGDLKAVVSGAQDGKIAVLAHYCEDEMNNVVSAEVRNGAAELMLPVDMVSSGSYARVYLWDKGTLEPYSAALSQITPMGVVGADPIGVWVSDNQITNHASSVAYHTFEAQSSLYRIEFNLKIKENGDCAILIGSSDNGNLVYATSSATLLFTGNGYFATRNGRGDGTYSAEAVNLCEANVGVLYNIVIEGDVTENEYKITITDEDEVTAESEVISARKNADMLDTIALISNSHNTSVNGETYSGYKFYVSDFAAEKVELDVTYTGFGGRYYALKLTSSGRYIRGNNGRLSADYTGVNDDSAKFFTRDMADGGYAFVCKSSSNRITSSSAAQGEQLASARYASNDQTQHWALEPSENFTDSHKSYYLKNLETGVYAAVDSTRFLAAGTEDSKEEILFEPLDNESMLVQASKTEAYAQLSSVQRARIEEVYASMASDLFGRYGGTSEYTPRLRMEAIFSDLLNGTISNDTAYTKLSELLNSENNHIYSDSSLGRAVSSSLPTASGVTMEKGSGEYSKRENGEGGYLFWSSTYLSGSKYPLTFYDSEGNVQQTMTLYVHDDSTAKKNADVFCSMITQIPYQVRKYIKNVRIRNDTANSYNCGASDLYIRLNWTSNENNMRSVVLHEFGHSIDMSNGNWSQGGGWNSAMESDMFTVSIYARSSKYEDFAEFHRLYFMCYGNQDWQKGIQVLFPNRYASLYRLRNRHLSGFALWEDTEYLSV